MIKCKNVVVVFSLLLTVVFTSCGKMCADEKLQETEKKLDDSFLDDSSGNTNQELDADTAESNRKVFSRNMSRTIPEGYTEHWNSVRCIQEIIRSGYIDIPLEVTAEYSMVQNNITGMYGIVDYEGKFIVEAKFNDMEYCGSEEVPYFSVEYEGEGYVIDINENRYDVSELSLPYYFSLRNDGNIHYVSSLKEYSVEESSSGSYADRAKNDNQLYIFDSNDNIISGPFGGVFLFDDVFCHTSSYANFSNEGDDIGFYDSVNNSDYIMDGALIKGDLEIVGIIQDKKIAIFEDLRPSADIELWKYNYETGEMSPVVEGSAHCKNVFENAIIYSSNDTYKYIDLEGNDVLDSRYYGYLSVDGGALLKNEEGGWLCINKNGTIINDGGEFYGVGDSPETYNGLPIVGYWKHDGISCVVVIENGMQTGYSIE
ncbi:MAG: hypothetical protein IKV59_02555 [Lachnospiraceae bacterium]|nr:hypothetical protein [Lachnospiraceae bacterium]